MRALNDVRYNGHKKFSEKSKSKEVGCPMKNREKFFLIDELIKKLLRE